MKFLIVNVFLLMSINSTMAKDIFQDCINASHNTKIAIQQYQQEETEIAILKEEVLEFQSMMLHYQSKAQTYQDNNFLYELFQSRINVLKILIPDYESQIIHKQDILITLEEMIERHKSFESYACKQ